VLVLDDLSTGAGENLADAIATGRVQLIEGSVLDEELVERCMRDVDACAHLAAAVGVKLILAKPLEAMRCNAGGAEIVMGSAARNRCRLLFTSSSEVYGKVSGEGLRESSDCTIGSPARSRWSYAIAKQLGEAAAHAYVKGRAAEFVVVRLFNTVGPRQTGAYGMVLPRLVAQALAGEPLTIYGDGKQSRCFTSVHDVTPALVALLGGDAAAGVFNLGSSQPIRIVDLAAMVLERTVRLGAFVHSLLGRIWRWVRRVGAPRARYQRAGVLHRLEGHPDADRDDRRGDRCHRPSEWSRFGDRQVGERLMGEAAATVGPRVTFPSQNRPAAADDWWAFSRRLLTRLAVFVPVLTLVVGAVSFALLDQNRVGRLSRTGFRGDWVCRFFIFQFQRLV